MKIRHLFFLVLAFSLPAQGIDKQAGFLFFGDFGTGGKSQVEVANGMKSYCAHALCQFIVGLGDNFYPKGVLSTTDSKWQTHFLVPYGPLGLDFYAALGNHDYEGNVEAQLEFSKLGKHWQMPATYFQFNRGDIDFFAIDTNKIDDTQLKWLRHVLLGSTAKWKIVFGHHPIYSYGYHGNTSELVDKLLPILVEFKTDFYLSGHDHDLQVIKAASGPLMIVSGAAAQSRLTKKGSQSEFASSELGFAHLLVKENLATLELLDKKGKEIFRKAIKK